jgi:pyruvate/2-oxoacid:ferredoxin oxidoreductase alpha subunit
MTPEVTDVLYDAGLRMPVSGFCVQLGGREIAADGIEEIIDRVEKGEQVAYEYFRIKKEILPDLVPSKD